MQPHFSTNSIKNRRDEVWELNYRQTHRTKNIKQKVFDQKFGVHNNNPVTDIVYWQIQNVVYDAVFYWIYREAQSNFS